MTFTVLVTDRVAVEGLAPLADDETYRLELVEDSTSSEFEAALPGADALIVRSATTVAAEMIGQAPSLKVIGRAGVGVDNVDLEAASKSGVAVFNSPGGNSNAAAEMTMALMLAMVRRVAEADRSVRAGGWDRAGLKGVELKGRTLGLIGAGRIGGIVANRCRAFGMKILCFDPFLSRTRAAELEIPLVSLEEVVANADVFSCHVPLNDETRGLVSEALLAGMKPGVFIINASRGGVVDEAALAAGLHSGAIAGAALDVFESEPLPDESPLRGAPNLTLTPHLGASTAEAQLAVATEVAEAIHRALVEGDFSGAINAAELR